MKQSTKEKGEFGEKLAEEFLRRKSFKILHKNHYIGRLEIDIIAEKSGKLYFFEVKSASCDPDCNLDLNFDPFENMYGKKLKNLERAVSAYVLQNSVEEYELHLLSIVYCKSKKRANFELHRIL